MRKIKYFILSLVVLGSLVFLFGPEVFPENLQPPEVLNLVSESDVIIIFNSGGWGNTPLEEAQDFTPIIDGIQETLEEWEYNTLVIPYNRTKDGFLGKVTGTKDLLNSFNFSSVILAEHVEFITDKFPDKKIIIAGLSNGGAFVDETMEKISKKPGVFAIEIGIPFWHETFESDSILRLNNKGEDSLVEGQMRTLIFSLVKAPFKCILAKMNGEDLAFAQAIQAPGHNYSWDSSEVGPKIVTFLRERLR